MCITMKFKIKQTDNDKKIVIPFGGNANLLGYDDDIQSLVFNETNSSINSSDDLEVKRFKSIIDNTFTMSFYFWNGVTVNPTTLQLAPLDFAANSLTAASNEARNSFYLIQIFDSFDEDTQTKLHTGYFNGYDFLSRSSGLATDYDVDNISEFLSIYIENSFLEGKLGQITLYAKFFFYSAESTKFYPFSFYNPQFVSNPSVEDIYVPMTFDLNTYRYIYPTLNIDLYEITNPDYATLVNNTVASIPVQQTAYPTGNTFTSDGIYINQ